MPNRIIKESICTSDTINSLSWFEEAFFYRLVVNCDDYGRLDARPAILKSKLFPLKERISIKDIESALGKLADAGCVRLYECDSKPYLYLPTWEVHQRIRNHKSKYPEPNSDNLLSIDSKSLASVAVIQSNPIQSESESESESESMPGAKVAPDRKPELELILNDKSMYPIYSEDISEWSELYPSVDVMQQLRNMKGWLDANHTRRKTKSGIPRFINNWLSKQQNSGNGATYQSYEAKEKKDGFRKDSSVNVSGNGREIEFKLPNQF